MPQRIIIPIIGRSRDEERRYEERAEVVASLNPQHKFLLEFRLDLMNNPDIKNQLKSTNLDTICTNRIKAEGGRFEGTERERFAMLQKAIDAGATYVDVELDYFSRLELGKTQLIVSHHNFSYTPSDMEDKIKQMIDLGANVAKIAVMPKTEFDVNAVLLLVERMREKIPIIGISMGELGQRTRYQAPICGGFATYACLDSEKAIAGQMTVNQLINEWEKLNLKRLQAKPI